MQRRAFVRLALAGFVLPTPFWKRQGRALFDMPGAYWLHRGLVAERHQTAECARATRDNSETMCVQ